MNKKFKNLMDRLEKDMRSKGVDEILIEDILDSCYSITKSLKNIKYETRYIDTARTFRLTLYTIKNIEKYSDVKVTVKDFSKFISKDFNNGIPVNPRTFYVESIENLLL